ncbi:MAG: hypothetical protein ACKVOE_08170 [Rickettsiales bacterium]
MAAQTLAPEAEPNHDRRPPVRGVEGAKVDGASDGEGGAEKLAMGQTKKPEIDPELILAAPSKADRSKPAKIFGIPLPEPLSNVVHGLSDAGSRFRFNALTILPGFIVNHSSNVIGLTQLVGEVLYFKSSGVNQLFKDEHKGTWKHKLYAPVNIVEGVFKKSAFRVDFKQLLNPKYMGQEIKRFFDLTKAAEVDFARDGKLSNPWSARSGFSGMMTMTISTLLPEEKDDPEKNEQLGLLKARNPIAYVGYRVSRGLMFPVMTPIKLVKKLFHPSEDMHIGDGKREFAGLGMTLTGILSVISGFRQPRFNEALNLWKYEANWAQAVGGAITTFAGYQLFSGLDNQQGWTNYGKTQFLRILPLYFNIRDRYPDGKGFGDPNARYYLGAQAVYQTKNIVASTIGGAQKTTLSDGRSVILDQKAKRTETQQKANDARVNRKLHSNDNAMNDNDIPSTKIQSAAMAEIAMPEKREAIARDLDAAQAVM